MNLTVIPGKPLSGVARLAGDKSISHRAALLAAMAEGESRIDNFLVAGVTRPLLGALSALGVPWSLSTETGIAGEPCSQATGVAAATSASTETTASTGCLTVRGAGLAGFQSPASPLDCGNSATVLRLLAGALSAAGVAAILDGSPGLRRRPMQRIVEPLARMGVPVLAAEGGGAPLTLAARPAGRSLRALAYRLPVASAQVKSCLLLAALAAEGPSTLIEPGPSRDHTERMLRSMGVEVHTRGGGEPEAGVSATETSVSAATDSAVTLIPPRGQPLKPLRICIPGDFSSAAFLIAAALITPGASLLIENVGLNPTRTGLLDALRSMGANIQIAGLSERGGEPVGNLAVQHGLLHGTCVEGPLVVRMIDEFPAFAVAAAFARGETVVRGAEELRYKESDRIASLGQELRALGVPFEETPDGFSVHGGHVRGGVVHAHGDHRLAMSLALAGLAAQEPVTVQESAETGTSAETTVSAIIDESFPGFVPLLQSLGADTRLED